MKTKFQDPRKIDMRKSTFFLQIEEANKPWWGGSRNAPLPQKFHEEPHKGGSVPYVGATADLEGLSVNHDFSDFPFGVETVQPNDAPTGP